MKKLITKLVLAVTLITTAVGFSSCSDDGYSLGDFWVSWATVSENGNSFVLDNGKTVWVAASSTNYQPKNRRVIIDYTILADDFQGYDYGVKLNRYLADVLTKYPVYAGQENEELGNDPISILDIWEGGGYLNVKFRMSTGQDKAHLVNLVMARPTTEQGVVNMELRHNAFGDEKYMIESYVSFNLKELVHYANDKGEVSLLVKVKEHNGDKEYKLTYKIKDAGEKEPEVGPDQKK